MKRRRKSMVFVLCIVVSIAMSLLAITGVDAASKANKAKRAYRSYLEHPDESRDIGVREKFALIDLNQDGVPELITTGNDMYHFNIWAYVDGEMVWMDGGFATCDNYAFYPNKKLIYLPCTHGGSDTHTYYKFDGTRMRVVAEKAGSWDINMKTGEPKTTWAEHGTFKPYRYTIKGKTVSAAKYKKYVKKLKKNAKKAKMGLEDLIDVNEKNLDKYL